MFVSLFRSPIPKVLMAAALALGVAGCAKSRKPVVAVRGQVLFRGKPADGALVVFNPVGETDPKAVRPQGLVGSDGKFEMSTYGEKDGAPKGEYAVTIVWLIENPKTKKELSPLPTRYMMPDQSGLRVTINDGPNELQPFQLTP
jgi:hypothetical protein